MRCGLTPTDFMHINGDYTEYDTEASALAAQYLLFCMKQKGAPKTVPELADEVYELVEGRLFENLLSAMIMRQYPTAFKNGVDAQTEFLIREAWANRNATGGRLFSHTFGANAAVVGIGAPTHIFLPAAAKALGANYISPEYAEVANALGALKAGIDVTIRVEISKWLSSDGDIFYIVHTPTGSSSFASLDDAIEAAKKASVDAASNEARSRCAAGEVSVNTHIERYSTESNWGTSVSLGSAVMSEAIMRL
jgi:N-methylhydantoinase A/oxoprolinase/acetone carboxylase beta subunit